MTFLPGLGEKIALGLTMDLVKASAAVVRRRLGKSAADKALQAAIAQALDEALASIDVPVDLSGHYASLLEDFFRREEVVAELAQLLDPRPDVELDFAAVTKQFETEHDRATLGHLDLTAFLRAFASAFYGAAASQEALKGNLEMKLLGEMVKRTGLTVQATERTAAATEVMTVLLQQYLEDQNGKDALFRAVLEAQGQGMLAAFQAFEGIAAGMFKAGFDFGVGRTGMIEIGGDLKALPPAQAETIRTLAGDLRRTVLDATPGPAELDALEQRYRQHIIRWFESLQFQGLMRTPRPIVLPLEDVYVELRAVAEVPDAADAFSVEERRLLLEDEQNPDGRRDRRELMSQLDALRRERWSRTLPERKSIAESLHQRDRRAFVILGDPGSGKTTLLHFLALVYARGPQSAAERLKIDSPEADRLPIFVPLAAFDDMLRESRRAGGSLTLLEFLPRYYDRRRGLPGLEPLFRRALTSGRAVVLLDGLDEVIDVGTRTYVAEQAGALINEWSPRGVRFAVSSRFVGYREAPVPGNLPTLSVLDFGMPEIEIFVHRWAEAYEKWAANGESPEMFRRARTLESDLLTDVKSNESVRRLAANPLMITMLALLRRQVGRLPHRRVQLYESYVGALLENWVDARSQGAREQSVEILDRHQAENLLIPLALWLQKEKPSGTAGRAEVQQKLTEICLEEAGLTGKATRPQTREAEDKALRFLQEMRQMTGLLIERGHDAFGFLHLTFQEYFAGRALARLSDEERRDTVRPNRHDPRWREPILLCAGRLGVVENRRPQVTDFVCGILDCPDDTEEKLHRNLLLALAIGGDDVNLGPGLVSEMVGRAVASLPTTVYAFARSLAGALGQLVANGAVQAGICFEKVWTSEDWRLREAVAEVLGRFAGVEGLREMLLERFEDGHSRVVEAALGGLGPQMREWQKACAAAVRKLAGKNVSVSIAAAAALKNAAMSDEKLRLEITELMESTESWTRTVAVQALAASVDSVESVKLAIVRRLDDSDSNVQRAAVTALAVLAGRDETIKLAIMKRLDAGDTPMQDAAVAALVELIDSDEEVTRALLIKLIDGYASVRTRVLAAFAGYAEGSTDLRKIIAWMLRDRNSDVRQAAVQALTSFLWKDHEVTQSFLDLLESGDERDKRAVLRSLAAHRSSRPQVGSLFTDHARSVAWSVRERVAEALGEMVQGAEDLNCLAQLLLNRDAGESIEVFRRITLPAERFVTSKANWRNYWIGKSSSEHRDELAAAVTALADSFAIDPACRQFIIGELESQDYTIFRAAFLAVANLIGMDAEVREVVLRRLGDDNYPYRSLILEKHSFSAFVETDAEMRHLALKSLESKGYSVREAAVNAFSDLIEKDVDIRRAIIGRLADEYSSVRHAALRALARVVEQDAEAQQAILKSMDLERFDTWQWALQAISGLANVVVEVKRIFLDGLAGEEEFIQDAILTAASGAVVVDMEIRAIVMGYLGNDRFTGSALTALSGAVEVDEAVRGAVLEKLGHKNSYVRASALEALASLARKDLDVRTALVERLEDEDSYVRWSTVRVLKGMVGTDPKLEEAILKRLEDGSEGVRCVAVDALSGLCGTSPVVTSAIVDRLSDPEFEVRVTAAEVLTRRPIETMDGVPLLDRLRPWLAVNFDRESVRELDPRVKERILLQLPSLLGPRIPVDSDLLEILLDQLREPDWAARGGAALALLAWPEGPPDEILDRIFEALDDRRGLEAYPAQLTAASFLINRNDYAREAIDLCLEALDYGARPWQSLRESREIRKKAALVLGKLEPIFFEERVYNKLLAVMETDEDDGVRDAAYGAVVRLARVREQVVGAPQQ